MDSFDPSTLIGLPPWQAEERLRRRGVTAVQTVVTRPVFHRLPEGEWRVLRCRWDGGGEAELLVARANRRHRSVQAALDRLREGP